MKKILKIITRIVLPFIIVILNLIIYNKNRDENILNLILAILWGIISISWYVRDKKEKEDHDHAS